MTSGIYRSRLKREVAESAAKFMSSITDDERILQEDILGTIAHEIMLHERGVISHSDAREILKALQELLTLRTEDRVEFNTRYEDIHEFVEDYVVRKTGPDVGGKLHTGRSRNDQVALDQRMALRKGLNEVSLKILDLIEVLLGVASENSESVMVGYTHTQHAQTTSFGHYLLAYVDVLFRDYERIRQSYDRVNKSPLGACALAGSSFLLDRNRTAELLGFRGLVENSADAVSSRDFALESIACLAVLMVQLSRISEDLILWSSSEFGYVEVDDAYASTSSVMPQKKNPCTLELIRGKTGRVCGELVSLLTTLKGLMTGYNRDFQEMKRPLWTSLDTAESCLDVLTGVMGSLKINKDTLFETASRSYALAVDLAEELARKGVSFRQAHQLVGAIVRENVESNKLLSEVSTDVIESYSQRILGRKVGITQEELRRVLEPVSSLRSRRTRGSPNPEEVKRMIRDRINRLNETRENLQAETKRLEKVFEDLLRVTKSITG